mmetsp:Transcript_48280/g.102665  ORF Transcript_48280/g.102665 Transcript_48280/m.102665 type:complete len:234 (+) Transcript_48280:1452-2153(+)
MIGREQNHRVLHRNVLDKVQEYVVQVTDERQGVLMRVDETQERRPGLPFGRGSLVSSIIRINELPRVVREVLRRHPPPQAVRPIVRKAEHLVELTPVVSSRLNGLDHVAVADAPILDLHRHVPCGVEAVPQPRSGRVLRMANALTSLERRPRVQCRLVGAGVVPHCRVVWKVDESQQLQERPRVGQRALQLFFRKGIDHHNEQVGATRLLVVRATSHSCRVRRDDPCSASDVG